MAFSSFFGSNPVLLRELRAGLRNARAFALLAIYVAILGAIVIVSFPADEKIDILSNGGVKGLDLFWILVRGQVLLILALLPALSTGALAQERERQTLEPLLLTPLSPLQIVWGKAGGVLSLVGLLLLASLPLTSLCFLLGGLSPGMLIAAYAGILGLAVFTTGFGLYCAARWPSATKAMMACYSLLPIALILVAIFLPLGSLFSGLCLIAMLFYGLVQVLKKGDRSNFAKKIGPLYGRLINFQVMLLVIGLLAAMYFSLNVGQIVLGVFVLSYFIMVAQWGLLQTARELMLRNDPEAPMRQKIADFKADWQSAVAPAPVPTAYVPTPQTQSEWAAVTMQREAPKPAPSTSKRKPADADTYGKTPFLSDKLNPIYARELRAGLLGKFEYLFRFSYILTILTEVGLFIFLLYSLYDPAYMTSTRYDDFFISWGRCHLVLLLIFGAWFGARAIAPEREGQTLPQLFTIPLPSSQIIGGKLAAVLTFTLYVMVLAIPLAVLLPMAGLVTWPMALRFLLVEFVMGLLSASWGVYCSFHSSTVRGAMAWALGGVSALMVAPYLVSPLHDVLQLLGFATSSAAVDIIGNTFPLPLLFAPTAGPGNYLVAYYRVPLFFSSSFQWMALGLYLLLSLGLMVKAARDFQRTAREI